MSEYKNDISDFLLKEYENIAQAFFNSREVLSKWVKYYLIVMAVPFSFIAFLYKEKPDTFDIFNMSQTLSFLILGIGVIGFFLSFIIIECALDSVLYARSVNGVRKFFVDRSIKNDNLVGCIVLPTMTNKPSYRGFEKFWITSFVALINSFYISFGFVQLFLKNLVNYRIIIILIFFVLCLVHYLYFIFAVSQKKRSYG